MRRIWFVIKVIFFGTAPVAVVLGTPIGAFGALMGGLIAAEGSGRLTIPAGIAIGAATTLGAFAIFIVAVQLPIYMYLFVTHFAHTNSLDPRPRRRLRLNVPPAKAVLACREAALQIPGASIDEGASSIDRIAARTPLTWQSWGERIRFDVRATPAQDRCDVIVSSRPAMLNVQIDYGVNERHVETAIAYLRKGGLLDEGEGIGSDPPRDGETTA